MDPMGYINGLFEPWLTMKWTIPMDFEAVTLIIYDHCEAKQRQMQTDTPTNNMNGQDLRIFELYKIFKQNRWRNCRRFPKNPMWVPPNHSFE